MGQENYILIVDDDADSRAILDKIITSMGFETVLVEDGREALAQMQQRPPALVLLDLMMPNMNGFGVVTTMQAMYRTQEIPVVVISAMNTDEVNAHMLPGVVAILQKTQIKVARVRELVHEILETT